MLMNEDPLFEPLKAPDQSEAQYEDILNTDTDNMDNDNLRIDIK